MPGKRIRLDILTPLSNTALEPMTAAMLSELPHVSAHFARLTVTGIALSEHALGQFDVSRILAAARQLADARMDVEPWVRWGQLFAEVLTVDGRGRVCCRVHDDRYRSLSCSIDRLPRMDAANGGPETPKAPSVSGEAFGGCHSVLLLVRAASRRPACEGGRRGGDGCEGNRVEVHGSTVNDFVTRRQSHACRALVRTAC